MTSPSPGPERGHSRRSTWIWSVLSFHWESQFGDPRGWGGADTKLPDDSGLWKQYEIYVDLFKFYIDIAWKGSVWFLATVGAILTFLFANIKKPDSGPIVWILLFVGIFSLGFCLLYARSALNLGALAAFLDYIASELALVGRPHVEFAAFFLLVLSVLCGLVGIASLVFLAVWVGR
jgi:hypothetical protein